MPLPDLSRRQFLVMTAAGAAGVALGACGGGDDPEVASTAATSTTAAAAARDFGGKKITTAVYAKNHASSPLFWQQFAPEGLTVEPVIFTSAGDISRALANGELDFGLMGPYNTLIEAGTTGMASRIIGMCSRQGIGLIGRKGVVAEPADLAGKKVAVPPPGVQTLALTSVLERAGLALDEDVQSVPLGYADHPGALERGDVDAYVGTEPLCTQSVAAGVGVRLSQVYESPLGDFNTAMWASPKNLDDEDLLAAVAKMQRDAAELLTPSGENSETEWKKLLVDQFGYTEAVYENVLENIGAVWEFDDERKSQMEGTAELLMKQGLIEKMPDIDSLLLLDYQPKS